MGTVKPISEKIYVPFISNNPLFFSMGCIILVLTTASGYLFYENQQLEKQIVIATHESEILDAEVPDPVIKYSPMLVSASDPGIKELAVSLGGPEEIYLFVRDKIEYSENYDQRRSALEVLDSGKGDCLGKSDLLAGLLLAYGYSREDVEVSMGYVTRNGEKRHHAWVELNVNGKWIVLDSSQFLGTFDFNRWDRTSFYEAYNAQPYAEFNDRYVHVNLDSGYRP